MGRRVEVEFIFSEIEWEVIHEFQIDIMEICRNSIKNEIRDRAETREIMYKHKNIEIENENLRNELVQLLKQLPVAAFAATPTYLSVAFTDGSTGTGPLTYAWDFGDSTKSNDQNPGHVYATAGTHTVKLTVTGPAGVNYVTQTVTVAAAPVAAVSTDVPIGTVPRSVKVTDTSTVKKKQRKCRRKTK
jgi:PKD repeat protein